MKNTLVKIITFSSSFLIIVSVVLCFCIVYVYSRVRTESIDLVNRGWYRITDIPGKPGLTTLLTDISDSVKPGTYVLDISAVASTSNKAESAQIHFDCYGPGYETGTTDKTLNIFGNSPTIYSKRYTIDIKPWPSNIFFRIYTSDSCIYNFKTITLTRKPSLFKRLSEAIIGRQDISGDNTRSTNPADSTAINCINSNFWLKNFPVVISNATLVLHSGKKPKSVWAMSKAVTFPTNTLYKLTLVFSEQEKAHTRRCIIDLYKPNAWDAREHNWYMQLSGIPGQRQTNCIYFNTQSIPEKTYIRIMCRDQRPMRIHTFYFEPVAEVPHGSYRYDALSAWNTAQQTIRKGTAYLFKKDYSGEYLSKDIIPNLKPDSWYCLSTKVRCPGNYTFDNTIKFQIELLNSNSIETVLRYKGKDIDSGMEVSQIFKTSPVIGNFSLKVIGTLHSDVILDYVTIKPAEVWQNWLQEAGLSNYRQDLWLIILKVCIPAVLVFFIFIYVPAKRLVQDKTWPWILCTIFLGLLILLLLSGGLGSRDSLLSLALLHQFIIIIGVYFAGGWWIAGFLLPRRWKKYACILALPCGAVFLTVFLVILCWWCSVSLVLATISFFIFSLIADILVFIFVTERNIGISRECLIPVLASAITFFLLMGPFHQRENYGIYSECIDGLTYCNTAAYAAEYANKTIGYNRESAQGPLFILKKAYRAGTALSSACMFELIGIEPHQGFRMYHGILHCLIPLIVYCITRLIFSAGVWGGYIAALFSGICPVLAYAVHNNSLSQSEGQLYLLVYLLLIIWLFSRYTFSIGRTSKFLIVLTLLVIVIIYTYWQVAFPYMPLLFLSVLCGWLSWRYKIIRYCIFSVIFAIIAVYCTYRFNLLDPRNLPEGLQKYAIPYNHVTGDIRTLLEPWYTLGMFDVLQQTHSFAMQNYLPVVPETYMYILVFAACLLCVKGWWRCSSKLKWITVFMLLLYIALYIYLRYHVHWAYAIKKHLGFCVPFAAVLLGLGIDATRKKRISVSGVTAVLSMALILVISGWSVWYTGIYWTGKNWYFEEDTMQLMNAIERTVSKTDDHIYMNAEKMNFSQFYLLRNWKYMTTFNIAGSNFAVIDTTATRKNSRSWFARKDQYIELYRDKKVRLVKRADKNRKQ